MSAQGEQMRVSRAFVLPWGSMGGDPSAESSGARASGRRPRPKPAAACFGLGHVALARRIDRSTEQRWAP